MDFNSDVKEQTSKNRAKWGIVHDLKHNQAEWALILGEQVGKLQFAILENNEQEIQQRIIKTAAVLKEMYEHTEWSDSLTKQYWLGIDR